MKAGDNFITIIVGEASSYLAETHAFYKSCSRELEINPADELILAFVNERLIGAVRLCLEYDVFALRSMQVHSDFQRKGVGKILLERFDRLLRERKIEMIYCMPYRHLEKFYGQIGFQQISIDSAPQFLQSRVEQFYKNRISERHVILMRRIERYF